MIASIRSDVVVTATLRVQLSARLHTRHYWLSALINTLGSDILLIASIAAVWLVDFVWHNTTAAMPPPLRKALCENAIAFQRKARDALAHDGKRTIQNTWLTAEGLLWLLATDVDTNGSLPSDAAQHERSKLLMIQQNMLKLVRRPWCLLQTR